MAKRKTKKPIVLTLQTFPATKFELSDGIPRYRKELIKVGKYIKDSTKQAFEVTGEIMDGWVMTFNRWTANGNKVPLPLSHAAKNDPDKNRGWLTNMYREGDVLVGELELSDEKLALTTDVSVCIEDDIIDGTGQKYKQLIRHVALCTNPVIPGLGKFEQLSLAEEKELSLSGDKEMDKKVLGKLLGITDDPTDENITASIEKLKKPPASKKVELSLTTKAVDPMIVKLMGENRQAKLETLTAAGVISPAVKDIITKKYVEAQALTLSLSQSNDDGFDTLVQVVMANKTVNTGELTEGQLELSNTRAQGTVGAITADVNRRVTEAKKV